MLHSNFGCCIGTIPKSATYKICGSVERRAVPIRELVDFEAHPVRLSALEMNLDIALQIISIALTVLLAYVGVEMANHPPTCNKQRWKYRIIFSVLGLMLIGINWWQSSRNAHEQLVAKQDAVEEQRRIEAQYNQVQGKPARVNDSETGARII